MRVLSFAPAVGLAALLLNVRESAAQTPSAQAAPPSSAIESPPPLPAPLPAPAPATTSAAPEPAAPARTAPEMLPLPPQSFAQGVPVPVWAAPPAQGIDQPAADKPAAPPRDWSRGFWLASLGARVGLVRSAGFDPFSATDTLAQASLQATRTVWAESGASLAAGLSWEWGGRQATARGAPSALGVYRAGGIVEGRYHLHRDLYGLVKFVPHVIYTSASIEESSVPNAGASSRPALVRQDWWFGLDSTAGVAWNFPRTLGAKGTVPAVWLSGEVGYGWTQEKTLAFRPDVDKSDPRYAMRSDFGTLSLSGMMMRLVVSISF